MALRFIFRLMEKWNLHHEVDPLHSKTNGEDSNPTPWIELRKHGTQLTWFNAWNGGWADRPFVSSYYVNASFYYLFIFKKLLSMIFALKKYG